MGARAKTHTAQLLKTEDKGKKKLSHTENSYWQILLLANSTKHLQKSFIGKFYKTFTERIVSILYKLFQKTEEEGTFSNLFYEASITLISKPERR